MSIQLYKEKQKLFDFVLLVKEKCHLGLDLPYCCVLTGRIICRIVLVLQKVRVRKGPEVGWSSGEETDGSSPGGMGASQQLLQGYCQNSKWNLKQASPLSTH